jgi:hypothetical protein
MKQLDNVGVVFVNMVLGRGILNEVVNLQFGTFLFSPELDGDATKVVPDLVVSARLRMDKACARELYTTLGELLSTIEKAETEAGVAAKPDGAAAAPTAEKLN